jgi:hypothetical protein
MKLVKVLGMLGSAHAGERAAAALRATRMMKAAGLTWGDILSVKGGSVLNTPKAPATGAAATIGGARKAR